MTYLKDIKLCVECKFYGNRQGQRDRCIHPALTTTSLVTGQEITLIASLNVSPC